MTDPKKKTLDDARRIEAEMDAMFNNFSPGRVTAVPTANQLWRPATDVWESDDRIVILMDLAGVDKDDVMIQLKESILSIKGARRVAGDRSGCCYRNLEINYGRFERNIFLPETVDPDQIEASFNNGFLEIKLRKSSHRTGDIREIEIGG